jgi:hypothetical protein
MLNCTVLQQPWISCVWGTKDLKSKIRGVLEHFLTGPLQETGKQINKCYYWQSVRSAWCPTPSRAPRAHDQILLTVLSFSSAFSCGMTGTGNTALTFVYVYTVRIDEQG